MGIVIQIVVFIILVFSVIFLKTKVGIGTILNVLLVGTFINIFDEIIYFEPSSLLEKLIILLICFSTALFLFCLLNVIINFHCNIR